MVFPKLFGIAPYLTGPYWYYCTRTVRCRLRTSPDILHSTMEIFPYPGDEISSIVTSAFD